MLFFCYQPKEETIMLLNDVCLRVVIRGRPIKRSIHICGLCVIVFFRLVHTDMWGRRISSRENWLCTIKRLHVWICTIKRMNLCYVPLKDCISLDLSTSVKSLLTGTYIPLFLTIHEPNRDIYAYIKVTYYNTSKN